MRFFIVVFILALTWFNCFSQWKQVYPITTDLFDVAVPAPGKIYVLSAEQYRSFVYISSDSAKTWRKSNPVGYEQTNGLVFTDSLTGFTASYQAVYKTTDAAKTWKKIDLPAGMQNPLAVVFPTKTTGYIIYSSNRIIKTIDGGETWTVLTNIPQSTDPYQKLISFSDSDHGYIVIDRLLYKTSDGGANWTLVPLNTYVSAICAVSQDVALISDGYQTLRTANGGDFWSPVWYSRSDVIHAVAQDTMLFFSPYGIVSKSADGGNTIGQTYQSSFTVLLQRIDSFGQFVCALGSDYSIFTSRDGGSTWKVNNIRPQHGAFNGVHFTDENNGLVISEDAGILRTTDQAKSWYYSEENMGRDDFVEIAFADSDTGIFVVTNNYAYTTNNGGKSIFLNDWTPPLPGHRATLDYEMVNSKVIYAVGASGSVAKSIDGGKSWIPFTLGLQNQLNIIKCLDANTCHAAGIAGAVISTWDGGEHWKVHNLQVNNDMRALVFRNATTGFIGGAGGMILRTSDGGQTWNKTDTDANWPVISFEFISDLKGFAITEGGEILRTDDGGVNWKLKDNLPLPNSWSYLKTTFMRDTTQIYALSAVYIYRWTAKEDEEPDNVTAVEEHDFTQLITIFPNPSAGILNFHHNEPLEEVIITDAKGRVVKHFRGDVQSINIADVSPGLYLVQLKLRGHTFVKRVIKL
ncbi:MAG TPA: YCF48-related protein [Chryseolinea sp.]